MSGRTRVVITGMGVVAPLGGDSVKGYWEALKAGKSGIGPMTQASIGAFPCTVAGEVTDFDPDKYINPRESRRMARFTQLLPRNKLLSTPILIFHWRTLRE